MGANHDEAPVLDALARYHDAGELGFTPPGHKQARGADPRARAVLGDAVFLGDVLAKGGLDDRHARNRVLERAEDLMADAVRAEHTYFSTCGSSLSVKASMPAVTCPGHRLLVGRDAHKPVIAGLILSGVEPVWVDPQSTTTAVSGPSSPTPTTRKPPNALSPRCAISPPTPPSWGTRPPSSSRLRPTSGWSRCACPGTPTSTGIRTYLVAEAPGRIDAEMITPYPPGIPVALPGERLTKPVLEHLTTGVRAGMFLPDAADRNLDTVRVVAEDTDR
ncbi:hypothetical protein [Streptomyces chartreusis]|uniref:Orn/Lys/Arg family decarboxylase n=1 Tax=Streptomyces chartreusis TaxID=1969 RepID=UPI002F91528F